MRDRIQILVLAILIVGLVLGCTSNRTAIKNNPHATDVGSNQPTEYLIQPGDELDIKFFYNPELNETVTVRPDGKISLQLLDELQAAGLTPSRLDEILTDKYSRELKKPVVTVIVRSFTGQRIYVGGEVNRQGIIDLTTGMTALQAVINAGGFKETAMPEGAIIIRKGPDNRPVPMQVDLKAALYGDSPGADIQLHPYDVVHVPKSAIAKANKWVNQYIEKLLLYRGLSFGFSYEVHADAPD